LRLVRDRWRQVRQICHFTRLGPIVLVDCGICCRSWMTCASLASFAEFIELGVRFLRNGFGCFFVFKAKTKWICSAVVGCLDLTGNIKWIKEFFA